MSWAVWNCLGVAAVWIGALLLFRYGAPFAYKNRSGLFSIGAYTNESENEARIAKRHAIYQWVAVGLITGGSIIQIVVSLFTISG